MLMFHTDLDEHLDFLENQQGHCFFLPRSEKDLEGFIKKVSTEILESEWEHTMIIIEQPTNHSNNFKLRQDLKKVGAEIDGKRTHYIHAFMVPSMLYKIVKPVVTYTSTQGRGYNPRQRR